MMAHLADCLLLLSALVASGRAVTQTPLHVYEPVLRHIQAEHPGRPLILYTVLLRNDCVRGGCSEPWADLLPMPWLQEVRARGLVSEYCDYQRGLCIRHGEPIRIADAAYVMFTSAVAAEHGCKEVVAHQVVSVTPRAAEQSYTQYRVCEREGDWTIESVTEIARGWLHTEAQQQ